MYLSRELTDASLPKIGKEFGGRDHTTVIHANAKITRLISEDRSVYNLVQDLTARIKQTAVNLWDRSRAAAVGPCGTAQFRPPASHTPQTARYGDHGRLPRRPHSLCTTTRGFKDMMETDIAVGSGLNVTVRPGRARRAGSPARLARRLDPRHRAGALRCRSCAAEGVLELAATDMELSLRTTLAAPGRGRRPVVVPGEAARRPGAAAACRRGDDRVPPGGRRRATISAGATRRGSTSSRPRTSRGCRRSTSPLHIDRDARCSRRSTASRARPRATSRGPVLTGILVASRAAKLVMAATDSYRLSVKETRARAAPAPTSRRSSRPAR